MAKAFWNGALLAESRETVRVEGNHYFPAEAIHWDYFSDSERTSICPWKGEANYYHVTVDGQVNTNAAWVYRQPKDAAREIMGHIAFWNGVRVEE